MKAIIEKLYTSLQHKDGEAMASCYHEDCIFQDPVFGDLKGEDVKAMWKMLCQNSGDLKIVVSNISASLKKGSANWEAWYTFGKSGRKVHNITQADFEFKEGKIISQIDNFNLRKWASQALGVKGGCSVI